jgi:diguanylate cyclase (GGDEF)-like protein
MEGSDNGATGGRTRGSVARRLSEQDRAQAGADQTSSDLGQSGSDADQTASDLDQSGSDADQTASERDAASARADQATSDQDQARLVRQRHHYAEADDDAGALDEASSLIRQAGTIERLGAQVTRTETARRRLKTAALRDAISADRDQNAHPGDASPTEGESYGSASNSVTQQLERIRERAAADRRRAAADREKAAEDRAEAATEIARLQAELDTAHLDDLTGAYRREVGNLMLGHEIERARRGDGSFVIAFVDVDGMKQINDRDGHAAGDNVLKTLVWTMRSKLRPFDPIVRYGGDEFVAGLGGACIEEATERFDLVKDSLSDEVGVAITVGLAELGQDETLEDLTARADALLIEARVRRDK